MWMHGYSWPGPWMIFGVVIWALIVAAVVVGIVSLIRALTRSERHGSGSEDALEILKGRYARGEVTKEQFDQMKRDLRE